MFYQKSFESNSIRMKVHPQTAGIRLWRKVARTTVGPFLVHLRPNASSDLLGAKSQSVGPFKSNLLNLKNFIEIN